MFTVMSRALWPVEIQIQMNGLGSPIFTGTPRSPCSITLHRKATAALPVARPLPTGTTFIRRGSTQGYDVDCFIPALCRLWVLGCRVNPHGSEGYPCLLRLLRFNGLEGWYASSLRHACWL